MNVRLHKRLLGGLIRGLASLIWSERRATCRPTRWTEPLDHVKEAFQNGVNSRVVMVVIWAIPYTAAKGKTVGAKLLSDISFVRIRVIIVDITQGREFGGCGCRGAVAEVAGVVPRINLVRPVSEEDK